MTRRSWTAQDQITAEVAAACGVSYCAIGKLLGRKTDVVKYHLDPSAAGKHRAYARRWAEANPDRVRENQRRYYEANADELRKANRCWHETNRDKSRTLSRRYYEANGDKQREYARRYRESNPEIVRECKRLYRKSNSDKIDLRIRHWQKANPEKVREYARRRNARERAGRQHALEPVTLHQVEFRRTLWRHRCAFCGVNANHPRNHGRKHLSVDHVLALISQGLDESSNIVPACFTCNSSKRATPIEKWYRRQPFFTEARWRKIQRHCPAAVVGQLPLAFSPAVAEPA